LSAIAPRCERFVGIDFSEAVIQRLSAHVRAAGLDHVELQVRAAHELGAIEERAFDTVLLNSVAQYFPGVDYLLSVLDQAWAKLAPGGTLFAGGVRSLPLLPTFCTWVELARAAGDTSLAVIGSRSRDRQGRERELLLDPAFFGALHQRWPDLERSSVLLKRGRERNEMTLFRHDAVLVKAGAAEPAAPQAGPAAVVHGATLDAAEVRCLLSAPAGPLRITDLADARLAPALAAAAAIELGEGTAAALREHLAGVEEAGVDPEALATLVSGWELELTPAASGDPGRFDALYFRSGQRPTLQPEGGPVRPWQDYANQPAPAAAAKDEQLVTALKAALCEQLPNYMQPSAVVLLDSLPRTPNGKIDRKALPEPHRAQLADKQRPTGEPEKTIAETLESVLAVTDLGMDENIFDLGANSLLVIRARYRLTEKLQREVSVADLFRYPTVRRLTADLAHRPERADHSA
jgi:Phosphopantetheine attachment site/Methyltransferase domain